MASIVELEPVTTPQGQQGSRLATRGLAALRAQGDFFLLSVLLLGIVVVLLNFRQVNLDEGWYLWASKLVYEGRLLYRDFAYTQTPVLPYLYGLSQQLLGEGLIQGRLLTGLFALGAIGFSVAAAGRVAGRMAALVCLAFCTVSLFALAQYTYTATYALTGAFLAAALWVAVADWPEDRRNGWATALVCLAIGVRLSVAAAALPLLLYLVWSSPRRGRACLIVAGVATAVLGLTIGVYWLLSGELMTYDILGFHTDRLLKSEWRLLRIWHTWQRTREDFLALVAVTVVATIVGFVQLWRGVHTGRWRTDQAGAGLLLTLAAMAAALFAVHLIPRTTDSYYNALQTPLMSLTGGILAADWLRQEQPSRRWLVRGLIALLVIAHGGRQWRGFVRDGYVVWPLQSQVRVVRDAAALAQRLAPPDGSLLSFSPHLALEAGLRLLPGYEMAIFAYRPTWTAAEAARYHVLNNERLLGDLRRGADIVALTQFDLEQIYGERAAVAAILASQYRWFGTVAGFGPYNDDLNLYTPPQFGDPQPQVRQSATLADGIALLGYDLKQRERAAQPRLDVALYWRAAQTPNRPYTVFVQLLDSGGARAAGWDNPPCRSTCPTTSWQRGEYLRDQYVLELAGLARGDYTLYVGMYDSRTGERLSVVDEAGRPVADMIMLTTVVIE